MIDYIAMFLDILAQYDFCEHYPVLRQYQVAALMRTLSQDKARLLVYQLQPIIEHEKDYPNRLHRAPTEEQLHEEGEPDVTVGHLVEDETIRIGLQLCGCVPHVLAAGSSGGGKTTLFRVIMDRVEALNAQQDSTEETHQPDLL